jgi:hypothetical protein
MDPGRLRVVLQDHRHGLADRLADLMEVALDLLIGGEAGGRRDHDPSRAHRHGIAGELCDVREPGCADADNNGKLARDLLQRSLDDQARFVMGELLRLAHHAEHGDAVHAGIDIEADQALEALQVESPLLGEGRGRDDEHALGTFLDQMAGHGAPPLRLVHGGK